MNAIRNLSTAERNRIRQSIDREKPASRINRLLESSQQEESLLNQLEASITPKDSNQKLHRWDTLEKQQLQEDTDCKPNIDNSVTMETEDRLSNPRPGSVMLDVMNSDLRSLFDINRTCVENPPNTPSCQLPWVKSKQSKLKNDIYKSSSVPSNINIFHSPEKLFPHPVADGMKRNESALQNVNQLLQHYIGSDKNRKTVSSVDKSSLQKKFDMAETEKNMWSEEQLKKFEHFNNNLKKYPLFGTILSNDTAQKLGTLVLLNESQVNGRKRPVGGAVASGTNSSFYLRDSIRKSPTIADSAQGIRSSTPMKDHNASTGPMLLVTRSTLRSSQETPSALRRRLSDSGRKTPHPADVKQFTRITDLLKLKSRRDTFKSKNNNDSIRRMSNSSTIRNNAISRDSTVNT